MPTTEISIGIDDGKIVVRPLEATVNRGDVIHWSTELGDGATIIPRQDGLTILKRTALPRAPAVALATNTGYYQYDVYWPGVENLLGGTGNIKDPQRAVAVLIVSEYIQEQGPDLSA